MCLLGLQLSALGMFWWPHNRCWSTSESICGTASQWGQAWQDRTSYRCSTWTVSDVWGALRSGGRNKCNWQGEFSYTKVILKCCYYLKRASMFKRLVPILIKTYKMLWGICMIIKYNACGLTFLCFYMFLHSSVYYYNYGLWCIAMCNGKWGNWSSVELKYVTIISTCVYGIYLMLPK